MCRHKGSIIHSWGAALCRCCHHVEPECPVVAGIKIFKGSLKVRPSLTHRRVVPAPGSSSPMPFAIIKRVDLNAPEMFIEVDETGKVAPTGTPIPESEARVLLRRNGVADPDIDREIERARRREV